jgi:hypothetical protein
MKRTESVHRTAAFLQKEVVRIVYSEIKKEDIADLYNALRKDKYEQRNRILWLCMGSHDCWFKNKDEFDQFFYGFKAATLILKSNDFLDDVGNAIPVR